MQLIRDTAMYNEQGQPKKITDHIIVGTPGKILNSIRKPELIDTSNIRVFVLDEADNMLQEGGLGDQSIRIKR